MWVTFSYHQEQKETLNTQCHNRYFEIGYLTNCYYILAIKYEKIYVELKVESWSKRNRVNYYVK